MEVKHESTVQIPRKTTELTSVLCNIAMSDDKNVSRHFDRHLTCLFQGAGKKFSKETCKNSFFHMLDCYAL